MQEDQGNRDILKIFARISTSQKQKMSECDKSRTLFTISQIRLKVTDKPLTNLAEAYYCTKNGKAKGILTLTEHLILFDPVKCVENDANEAFVSSYSTNSATERPEEVLGYH